MQALQTSELLSTLTELEVIPKEDLEKAVKESQAAKISLAEVILRKDLISDENLGKIIADKLQLPFITLSKIAIDENILHIVPYHLAQKYKLIAFSQDDKGVKVAMADPTQSDVKNNLAKKINGKILVYFATEKDIDDNLRLYKQDLQKSFDKLLKQQTDKGVGAEPPVTKIVDLLFEYAYDNKTSDIHIEPEEEQSAVRFRIDGVLHDVVAIPKHLHEQIVTRIKVLSKLRTDEHLSAQDGKLQFKTESEDLDIRVSIVPIVNGEKVVLRLLSSKSREFSLGDLGMGGNDLTKVKDGFSKPFGMILATGPTGSGKTTTIYSILKILNTREKNIATIEDPVEYDIEGINQIQVNPKTNLTFAEGLRSILRQDPDIVFVGEIRDKETAGIAINAAMTGHLVLSTLHTNDAATSLPRLIDMNIEPFLVASTVNVIIAQRLVRKICQKCRVSSSMTTNEFSKHVPVDLVKKHFGDKKEVRIYHGNGCPVCHSTGYSGRIGVFEVLIITGAIRTLISSKANSEEITKKAVGEGMSTMLDDGLNKVQQGMTTLEEILRATKI